MGMTELWFLHNAVSSVNVLVREITCSLFIEKCELLLDNSQAFDLKRNAELSKEEDTYLYLS